MYSLTFRLFTTTFLLVASTISELPGLNVSTAQAACGDGAAPGVDWQNCRKRNLIMQDFDFSSSNFSRADLSASDLRGTKLDSANFFKTNLLRASLAGATARDANFEGVIASRTDFSGGDYTGANFSKAEISRSNFSGSNLQGVDMSKSEFSRVVFSSSNLNGVDLSFTNLARADLRDIKHDENLSLEGAFLFLTNIEGLDFSNLRGIAQWQIDMACGDDETQLPSNISRPDSWPCKGEKDTQ